MNHMAQRRSGAASANCSAPSPVKSERSEDIVSHAPSSTQSTPRAHFPEPTQLGADAGAADDEYDDDDNFPAVAPAVDAALRRAVREEVKKLLDPLKDQIVAEIIKALPQEVRASSPASPNNARGKRRSSRNRPSSPANNALSGGAASSPTRSSPTPGTASALEALSQRTDLESLATPPKATSAPVPLLPLGGMSMTANQNAAKATQPPPAAETAKRLTSGPARATPPPVFAYAANKKAAPAAAAAAPIAAPTASSTAAAGVPVPGGLSATPDAVTAETAAHPPHSTPRGSNHVSVSGPGSETDGSFSYDDASQYFTSDAEQGGGQQPRTTRTYRTLEGLRKGKMPGVGKAGVGMSSAMLSEVSSHSSSFLKPGGNSREARPSQASNGSASKYGQRFMFRSNLESDTEYHTESDTAPSTARSSRSRSSVKPRPPLPAYPRTFTSSTRPNYHYLKGHNEAGVPENSQDIVTVIPEFGGHKQATLLAVYDGHGMQGSLVSQYASKKLPKYLAKHRHLFTGDLSRKRTAVTAAAEKCQKKMAKELDTSYSGSTACLALLLNHNLVMANIGDSRGMVVQQSEDGVVHANLLTNRHRPEFPEEMQRIVSNGGEVKQIKGRGLWRVYKKGEHHPGLPLSRSLGDKLAHKLGVSTLPDVRELWLSTRDFFVVVGTAGLWEVFPPQDVADWLWMYARLAGRNADLSAALCIEAEHRWRALGNDVMIDDISCAVSQLQDVPAATDGEASVRESVEDEANYVGFKFVYGQQAGDSSSNGSTHKHSRLQAD